jgi:hypothetical protein
MKKAYVWDLRAENCSKNKIAEKYANYQQFKTEAYCPCAIRF